MPGRSSETQRNPSLSLPLSLSFCIYSRPRSSIHHPATLLSSLSFSLSVRFSPLIPLSHPLDVFASLLIRLEDLDVLSFTSLPLSPFVFLFPSCSPLLRNIARISGRIARRKYRSSAIPIGARSIAIDSSVGLLRRAQLFSRILRPRCAPLLTDRILR